MTALQTLKDIASALVDITSKVPLAITALQNLATFLQTY